MLLFLLIAPLVVWRAAYMLQEESGPKAIFSRLRAWLAINTSSEEGGFFDGFTCFKCLSVWLSMIYCLFLGFNLFEWVAASLAVSAVAIFIGTVFSKSDS